MNRIRPIHVCLITLLSPILLFSCITPAPAQLGRPPKTVKRPADAKPFIGYRDPMPPQVTRKPVKGTSRAQPVTASTIDITPNTPLVSDTHPFWSRDEQVIAFQSNREDLAGTKALAQSGITHLYRMNASGGDVRALTGPLSQGGNGQPIGATTSQSEPAFNTATSTVVYIERNAAGGANLMELDLIAGTARSISQSAIDPVTKQRITFTDFNHPEYGPAIGGNIGVLFAGKTSTDPRFHIWTLDTQTGNAVRLTTGSAADDLNPTLGPDPNLPVIAFDSNRADATGNTVKATRDVWAMGINPNIQNATKVTDFSANGTASENIQPSWSTNKVDQPAGSQHIVNGRQLLAFATNRVDTNNDGVANAVGTTHDIYWLPVTVATDPNNPSVYTITTPESASNPALKLTTNDPQHQFDDLHPTWPQFIATYRVAYQSDRTFYDPGTGNSGPNKRPFDIFASTLIDLNAPTLIRFDDVSGDVLSIEPRLGTAGSPVTFTVKVADFESGIPRDHPIYGDGVFVQVKNPNSKYQSSDGLEHKVYSFITGLIPDNNTSHVVMNVPIEYESEPIFIGSDPKDSRFNTYPGRLNNNQGVAPRYTASQDDFFAFSGEAHQPDAKWLPLKFVSRDPVTGISTYQATWTTDSFPSDYYVDLIVYDQAVNPFAGNNAGVRAMNWKIYDNVWGFTTRTFQASNGILFVSDYAAGQKFFSSRFNVFTLDNVSFTFYGTESWMTDIAVALLPTQYTGNPPGAVLNMLNALGVKSYSDGLTNDGTSADGAPWPATQKYDLWRILCRGRLPDNVLQQYLPHMEQQPPDTINGETTPRSVRVAPRCVIWHAPYTGDVFTGGGTLTDLAVQTQIRTFMAGGGRILVNGQDIAWALTLNGAVTGHPFINTDMRAQFVADDVSYIAGEHALTGAPDPNPIAYDAWPNIRPGHNFPGPSPDFYETITDEGAWLTPGTPAPNIREYAAFNVAFSDQVTSIGGAIWDLRYSNGNTAVHHFEDTATGARVVYAPMGLEGLNADAWDSGNSTITMQNRRTELLHNAVCWFRTGVVYGTVRDVDAGKPIPGVLVRLTSGSTTSYTAITDDSGNYIINGVVPAVYGVTATRAGFTIQKPSDVLMHGGYRAESSFRMTKAEPAIIRGKVTEIDGTTPIAGATVTATDVNDAKAVFTATTDAKGDYVIDRVPAQTKYTLTVTKTGYGASIPAQYTVPDPQKDPGDTLVQPAKTYDEYDFQLKAEPGTVNGKVVDDDTGAGLSGATITATKGSTTVNITAQNDGTFSATLDPGVWSLVAVAPGHSPNSPAVTVTVVTGQTVTVPDIRLKTIPPGSISGLVTRTSDNAPLSGVLITVKDAAGNTVATATTNSNTTANFSIANVPAGVTYTVTASKNGFTSVPAQQSVAVTSGQETKNVNFQMEPLHTFPGALSLVSAPYDYAGTDVADLLSIPAADRVPGVFLFATWELARYVFYPTPPANTFRLGRGYFMAYKTNLPLSITGTAADPTRPYNLSLNTGWNLIGDPFPLDIDWTKVDVVVDGAVVPHDQAVALGHIGSSLYTYVSGGYALDFKLSPWKGYWVRAFRNVTLRIDPVNDLYGRAATIPATRAVLQGGNGWSVNLRATVGGVRDEDNFFGVSSRAADGYDGFKAEKPPVFGNRYVYLTFDHKDWGAMSGGYGVDVRSAAPAVKTWEVSVQTNVAGGTASLTWPNTATVGRNVTLTLTDLTTGATRDMRSSSGYTWQAGDTAETRRFRIEATQTGANSLRITDVVNRAAGRGTAGVSISYNLSMAANVEVRILGANGTMVRRVTGRATRAAGINQVTWDAKSDQGVAMPSGAYIVEIRAQTPDGRQTVRHTAPVLITR